MGSGATKFRILGGRSKKLGDTPRASSYPVVNTAKENESRGTVHRAMTDVQINGKVDLKSSDVKESSHEQNKPLQSNKETLSNGCSQATHSSTGTLKLNNARIETPPLSARKASELKVSKFCGRMSASELYNLLVGETWQGVPQIHDMGFMLLLDCRDKALYEMHHIITSRHHSALYSEYGLLLPSQIKLFNLVVLYGSNSSDGISDVIKKLAEDEIEHYLLESTAESFFRKYPFLATQNNYLTSDVRRTLQTMPSEILRGRLFQGNAKHALDPYIISSLGITHIVNVTLEHPNKFEDTVQYLRIQLDDRPHVDLHSWLPRTSVFIDSAIGDHISENDNIPPGVVLVHCNLGRSRSSTVVLGYLMQMCGMTLGEASRLLKDARPSVRPNIGFLEQLLRYEKDIFGFKKTELNDLPF